MKMENANPLLCDYETGICEIPHPATTEEPITIDDQKQKPVQIIYFTDPICSSCWGIEPQLRKLKLEYGAYFDISYHMGGLLPAWQGFNGGGITKPSDVAHHWDEVSRYYEMPIDGDIWLEDPLDSSYPPSIAFIAAKMQDKVKAEKFLRRLKEMVFIEKRNIAKWEYLQLAASESGLDLAKFKQDFEGEAIGLFQTDLDFAKSRGVRGFPTLFFTNGAGEKQVIYGVKSYGHFEQAIRDLHPAAVKDNPCNCSEDIFTHYPTLTTREFAVITDQTTEESQILLQELADRNIVQKVSTKNGAIWSVRGAKTRLYQKIVQSEAV